MEFKHGLEIVNSDERIARITNRASFQTADIHANDYLVEKLKETSFVSQAENSPDNIRGFNLRPRDDDYIYVKFRALSKTITGNWLDWTKDGVLEASVSKLVGTTVYPNHEYSNINNWLGVVNQAEWDAQGKHGRGVPGINAEYKIDAFLHPRIARGLLMSPPAIHSTSMSVFFEFEFSHENLAREYKLKYFDMLGQEVDGETVRLIVSNILEYWDASLVFQGADRLAKKIADEEHLDRDFSEFSSSRTTNAAINIDAEGEKNMGLKENFKNLAASLGFSVEDDPVASQDGADGSNDSDDDANEPILPPSAPPEPDDTEILREKLAVAERKAVEVEATAFVESEIKTGRMIPAEKAAFQSLYIQAALDDVIKPLGKGSRVNFLKSHQRARKPLGLTEETIDAQANQILLAGQKTNEDRTAELLQKTPLGKKSLELIQGGKVPAAASR